MPTRIFYIAAPPPFCNNKRVMFLATFYIFTAVITVLVLYWFIASVEHVICHIRRQIPLVPSTHGLRRAVITEIQTHYPQMRTACDIGSGYGGLARMIARQCNMDVVGLENMPFAAMVSNVADRITRTRSKTVWCDAFEYLAGTNRVDIAVAYMGPGFNEELYKYADKFQVLITMVIPAEGLTPTRVITLPHGYTRYSGKKYPHKLFVYEMP